MYIEKFVVVVDSADLLKIRQFAKVQNATKESLSLRVTHFTNLYYRVRFVCPGMNGSVSSSVVQDFLQSGYS